MIIHQPIVRKVTDLGGITLQHILEKIVKQLVSLFAASWREVESRLHQIHNLVRN